MEKIRPNYDIVAAVHYLMRIDSKRTLEYVMTLWTQESDLTSEVVANKLGIDKAKALSLLRRLTRIINDHCGVNLGFKINERYSKEFNPYGENIYSLEETQRLELPPPEVLVFEHESDDRTHLALELLKHKSQLQVLLKILLAYPNKWYAIHIIAELIDSRRHLNRDLKQLFEIINNHPNPLGVKIEKREVEASLNGRPSFDFRVIETSLPNNHTEVWVPAKELQGPPTIDLQTFDSSRFRQRIKTILGGEDFTLSPPRDADGILENAAWLLRGEKCEMDAARLLLHNAKNGQVSKGIEFRKEFNISDRAFFEYLQTRTQRFSDELGFAIVRISTGYYSLFFKRDGLDDIDLAQPFEKEKLRQEVQSFTELGSLDRLASNKIALLQSKGKPEKQSEIARTLGISRMRFRELIKNMYEERYANGFYPIRRTDNRMILIQLDLDAIDKRKRRRT